jgi:hypothetical protein
VQRGGARRGRRLPAQARVEALGTVIAFDDRQRRPEPAAAGAGAHMQVVDMAFRAAQPGGADAKQAAPVPGQDDRAWRRVGRDRRPGGAVQLRQPIAQEIGRQQRATGLLPGCGKQVGDGLGIRRRRRAERRRGVQAATGTRLVQPCGSLVRPYWMPTIAS